MIFYGAIINSNQPTLEEAMQSLNLNKLSNVHILVDKNNFKLKLYSDSVLVKTYKVALGRNRSSIKKDSTFFVTPTGKYLVCKIGKHPLYYKILMLNYPNLKDAAEALKRNVISKDEYRRIIRNQNKYPCSYSKTRLGGGIGIHGIGKYDFVFRNLPFIFNWTKGSIAISNSDLDELIKVIKIGTEVEIIN